MTAQICEEGWLPGSLDEAIFVRLFPSGSLCTGKTMKAPAKAKWQTKTASRFQSAVSIFNFVYSLLPVIIIGNNYDNDSNAPVTAGRHRAEAGKVGAEKSDPGNAADDEMKVAARRARLAVASEGGRPPH
jgi:hypothetical protein